MLEIKHIETHTNRMYSYGQTRHQYYSFNDIKCNLQLYTQPKYTKFY